MSIITSLRGKSLPNLPFLGRQLFASPPPAGRKITAGFTYLQRISKAASFDVWFPDILKREIEARRAAGMAVGAEQFPAEWAAVREFDLLQESGNHKIYDLDPANIQRAMLDLSRSMRAGGYRVTVATLGSYQEPGFSDELEILDQNLQERIAQMIHMLYLSEASDQANAENDAKLVAEAWDYRQNLPHVGMVLGARELFHPFAPDDEEAGGEIPHRGKCGKKGGSGTRALDARRHQQARQFFNILNELPQSHIVHDTAVGLQLPELSGENQWNYIASPDETLAAFNRVLGDLFDKFNGMSLSRLQGGSDPDAEIKSSTLHLRGYGDRLSASSDSFYRRASLALN